MQSIDLSANAKLNLALSVTGKRADGYHEIDTVMQAIDLCDLISITKSDALRVACEGIDEQENLAFRAARLFFKETGISGGAFIRLTKRIPVAAGLGGGSSDAAAVLTGLNSLYCTGVSSEALSEMAVSLGADVPFFLLGGTARARGIGEKLEKVDCRTPWYYLLFREGQKLSTGEMYRRLDSADYPKPDIDAAVEALRQSKPGDFLAITDNSFSALWAKSEIEELLLEAGAKRVLLSGSGPTRFALFDKEEEAERALRAFREKGIECLMARPAAEA